MSEVSAKPLLCKPRGDKATLPKPDEGFHDDGLLVLGESRTAQ